MKLAVTGASGFVGGTVCRAAAARGWHVTGFGRRATVDFGADVDYRTWDITTGPLPDPPDVDAVVHCAAAATDTGDPRDVWAANLDGTRHVLASFPRPRFVHVSTASVYDPFRPTVRAPESAAPVARYLNAYGASKAAAERLVTGTCRRGIALRPHAVYGPGDTTLLPRLAANVRRGRLFVPGDGTAAVSVTSVDNLATACLLAAGGDTERGVFNVADDDVITIDAAVRGLLAMAGVDATPRYVPQWLAWPVARLAELAGPRAASRLNRYLVSQFAMERTLDLSAARAQLAFHPTATRLAAPAAVPG